MSPRSSKQFDDIRKQKKELIMNSALVLFAGNGFHATSISDLAKHAGISKGLIYNYFGSKTEILDELIANGFNKIFENLDINKDGILSEEEFVFLIRQNFKLIRENSEYWKLFFSLMLQPKVSESFSKEYKDLGEPMFRMIHGFIKSQGSKDPDGDLIAVSSMLEGAFLYSVVVPDMFPSGILEEKIIEACFKIIN